MGALQRLGVERFVGEGATEGIVCWSTACRRLAFLSLGIVTILGSCSFGRITRRRRSRSLTLPGSTCAVPRSLSPDVFPALLLLALPPWSLSRRLRTLAARTVMTRHLHRVLPTPNSPNQRSALLPGSSFAMTTMDPEHRFDHVTKCSRGFAGASGPRCLTVRDHGRRARGDA